MSCSKCVGVTPCPQRIPVCMVGELLGPMPLEKLDLVIMSKNIEIRGWWGGFSVTQTSSEVFSWPLSVIPALWGNKDKEARSGGSRAQWGSRGSYVRTALSPFHSPLTPHTHTYIWAQRQYSPNTQQRLLCGDIEELRGEKTKIKVWGLTNSHVVFCLE